MKKENNIIEIKKNPKEKHNIYETFEHNINIRKKSLSILDSKLKFRFRHLHTLLDKINNVKELVVFNKYDTRDLKSLKNLDNNALLFSKKMKEDIKKSSDLLYAYNLSPNDLDNFMIKLESKKKKYEKEDLPNYFDLKKDYEKIKKEFDLLNLVKDNNEKIINKSFFEDEKKMRDLYNLKLELFLNEERKKIGEKKYFEIVKKAPICIKEKDKLVNPLYSTVKSKYYEKYKLSKSFEMEEIMIEKKILDEEENENNKEICTTKNKQNNIYDSNFYLKSYYTKDNISQIPNKYFEEVIKEKNNNNKNFTKLLLNKKTINKIIRNDNTMNIEDQKKKPSSAHMINNNRINSSSFNTISKANIKTLKIKSNIKNLNIKNNRVNSARNIQRNNYYISKPNYIKVLHQNNFTDKNKKRNRTNSPFISSKQTLYSSTTSSRAMSAFSSLNNNNTIYNINKSNTIFLNKNSFNNNICKYKKNSNFTNYIKKINKILKYSNYRMNNFIKSINKLNTKKLFEKSNSEIFLKKNHIDLQKINESLNLEKNRHSMINDKKLIYNNSKKVKLMLTPKNRNILNTILMELIVKQNRVNGFFLDLTHYEKMVQKATMNRKFEKLANEIMKYEKRLDKEEILEIFKHEKEKLMEYLKEKKDKDKYEEEEWKHILLKHKNMRIINSKNINKTVINGNLHKKHLVSKFKKEKF